MPGSEWAEAKQKASVTGHVEPGVGLQEAKAPLPYLRSRNALKIILDLDENFGRVKVPMGKSWLGLPKVGVPGFGFGDGAKGAAS